jgi:hypothetical protein
MNCYICNQHPDLATLRFGIRVAVGVCRHCGIAVCEVHSVKGSRPGDPLLCESCAEVMKSDRLGAARTTNRPAVIRQV